ncbi:DUF1573 domain-containing protein [Sunxiuqinia dokdonensis]|uniref:DUF1573 domain-containing protein n=1 Tax=Sunxiuqinia dokdonensis TaxID=1409788 RepID=A0A0L8VAG2_9BACT|nr:DUF1573 domain-containing protein [Sunxiuqinia dokdonensis]KOH45152.1 hypothetical protein NC99_20140 [Sunxiuqinia dokdonensis]
MKNTAAIVMLLVLLGCQNKDSKTTTNTGTPKFEFQEEFYNFGSLQAGEVVSFSFGFSNSGDGTLIIEKVEADCGCITIHFPEEPIAPGESDFIEVVFNSAGETGRIYKEIMVYANTQAPTAKLAIVATVNNELINLYSKN